MTTDTILFHKYVYRRRGEHVHVSVFCNEIHVNVPLSQVKDGDYTLANAGNLVFRATEWDRWRALIAQTGFERKSLIFFKEIVDGQEDPYACAGGVSPSGGPDNFAPTGT